MTYKLPSPSIYQILTRASQDLASADLLACLVGPLNQVETEQAIILTYPITNTTVTYPNQAVGSVVDTTSVVVKLTNAVISLNTLPAGDATGASMVTAGDQTITKSGAFVSAAVGDNIIFATAPSTVFTISEVTSDDAVEVEEVPSFDVTTGTTYTLRRNVGSITATATATYASTSFTMTALKYLTYTIVSGSANVSYVALRKDLTGFYELTNADQLAIDMDVDVLNPLGYYLNTIMLAASGGTKKILAYILDDNTTTAFINALSDLSTRKDPYCLVPLSTNSTVLNAYAAHATAMSLPETSYFRSAILNATLTTESTITNGIFTK
jgi:hypothetical protein